MATQSQLADTIKQNKYTNVTLYHENGIKGKGINILNIDSGDHGGGTDMRVRDSAPEANIYTVSMDSLSNNNGIETSLVYDGKTYTLEKLIKELKIKIITRSLGGGSGENPVEVKFWGNLRDKYNLFLNQSSGNKTVGASIPHSVCTWWTQVNFDRYGRVIKAPLIADGEQIDLAMFTSFLNGSSFASPYGAGMEALIISRYGDYGLNMSHAEMFEYLKLITEKVYGNEKDTKVGYGLPILPTLDKKYITMQTNTNIYYVDGVAKKTDTKPVNKNGNILCPIRIISESLGYAVKATFNNDKTIHIVITNGITEVVLNTNNNIMYVNGAIKTLNIAPYIDENNRTLVPIRAITEAFNCKVGWVQKENKVIILG